MTNPYRTWLIAALNQTDLPDLAPANWPALISTADDEGVLNLLEYKLPLHPQWVTLPTGFVADIQSAAKYALLHQLPFFAEQKAVYQILNKAEIPFLVMKGAALGYWLYDSPSHRPVTDIDIWFADRQTVRCLAEVLGPHGFACVETSGDLISFEQALDKTFNGIKIRLDAHWSMFNSALLSPVVRFDEAYSRNKTIDIHSQQVKVLSITDALINSIGHRAKKNLSQQENTLKWLYDQHLLFSALNAVHWQELIERCANAGISDLALDALEQSALIFNTQVTLQYIEALTSNAKNERIKRGWFRSWPRYQWHEMHAVSPKLSIRLKWLGQKLWPNPEAMREGYGRNDSAWRFMLRRFVVGLKRLFE